MSGGVRVEDEGGLRRLRIDRPDKPGASAEEMLVASRDRVRRTEAVAPRWGAGVPPPPGLAAEIGAMIDGV